MAMKALCETFPVENAKADFDSAARIGKFRFGAEAVYQPAFLDTQYLAFRALNGAWVQKSSIAARGCCGAQLPIYVLRLQYGEGFFLNLSFDTPRDADRALEAVHARRPELPGDPSDR